MKFYKSLGILESLDEVGDSIKVNSVDASLEKHVPFCEIKDDKVYVTIGEVIHPMGEDHYIEWIAMVKGNKIVKYLLKPNDEPKAIFDYEENSSIYAYCNKHGLWKKEI
ncbi:MAG TPA: desulfoferrodoxin [Candidatus Faecisoma merdavium]|nr:desulfoferrodoxin [Candidatus Coprovivens excrementavium]HIS91205.1 desulfoferrodoxin [Candidatus Faecisoma merdavium]